MKGWLPRVIRQCCALFGPDDEIYDGRSITIVWRDFAVELSCGRRDHGAYDASHSLKEARELAAVFAEFEKQTKKKRDAVRVEAELANRPRGETLQ